MNWSNIWNHPKTSAAGVLTGILIVVGVFSQQGITLGNIGTGSVITLIGALATAFLGLLSRDPSPTAAESAPAPGKLRLLLLILACGLAATSTARAQLAPNAVASPKATAVTAAPAGFVASSDVLAIGGPGGWSAGNLTTESYDFLDYGASKSSRVFLQGIELSAPGPGFSIYGGGIRWQPDLSALLSKTNLPSGNFIAFVDVSAGAGVPSKGTDRVSAVVGGGINYILSDNLTWNTVRYEEVFFGANRYPAVSTGIAAYFGGTPASSAASPNVRRSILKRAAAVIRASNNQ
jgi:hypothetical protein